MGRLQQNDSTGVGVLCLRSTRCEDWRRARVQVEHRLQKKGTVLEQESLPFLAVSHRLQKQHSRVCSEPSDNRPEQPQITHGSETVKHFGEKTRTHRECWVF